MWGPLRMGLGSRGNSLLAFVITLKIGTYILDFHNAANPSPLRAKRSNPGVQTFAVLDCFVASLLAMTGSGATS